MFTPAPRGLNGDGDDPQLVPLVVPQLRRRNLLVFDGRGWRLYCSRHMGDGMTPEAILRLYRSSAVRLDAQLDPEDASRRINEEKGMATTHVPDSMVTVSYRLLKRREQWVGFFYNYDSGVCIWTLEFPYGKPTKKEMERATFAVGELFVICNKLERQT